MSYYYNGNYSASSANGGYPARGGQGNGIPPAMGHSIQQPQALHQHVYQQPSVPQQQAPRQNLPPPPIHFVLDRQYTLCRAPSPPAQPAPQPPVSQYVPAAPVPHYSPARDGPLYTPPRNVPHHTPTRDGPHYAPTPSNGARYVPPALRSAQRYTLARNVPHSTPAGNAPSANPPHTHYAPAPVPAPALVPFRCSHPQCGGRVVMVPSAREHMWAAHRVRV